MLGKIREQSGSWFFKTFLTVIALSFILWGVGELATGRFNSTAITINGTKIPAQSLSRAYQISVRNMEKRLQSELNDAQKQKLRLGERTIGSIIRETLLTDYASSLGVRVSDAQLNSVLRNMDNFKNADGVFDKNVYRNSLRTQNDMTVEGFEKLVKSQLSRMLLNSIFNTPALTEKQAIERVAKYNRAELDINVLKVGLNNISKVKEPTNEELKEFYDKTLENWQTAELRNFDVLNISAATIADSITITDKQAQEYYKDNINEFNVPNKRKASHILVKTEKQAKDILEKIKKGQNFETLAKKYSTDKFSAKSGGNIGKFAKNAMVAEFSDVAFSLKKGEISDVVKTLFGYHIIKITGIYPAYLQKFEAVKKDIKHKLAANKAEKLFAQTIEEVEDNIAGGETLADIAKRLNIPLKSFKDKTRWDGIVDSSMLAPVESTATRTSFTLNKGDISDKIDLADTNSIYVELTSIKAPIQEPFNLVKKDLIQKLVQKRTFKKLAEKATELNKLNRSGKSLKKIAKKENLSKQFSTIKGIDKNLNNAPSWFNGRIAAEFFNNPAAKALSAPIFQKDAYYIVEVAKRSIPAFTDEMLQQDKARINAEIANDLRLQYIKYLYENADISFNIPLIRSAMPGEVINEDILKR